MDIHPLQILPLFEKDLVQNINVTQRNSINPVFQEKIQGKNIPERRVITEPEIHRIKQPKSAVQTE